MIKDEPRNELKDVWATVWDMIELILSLIRLSILSYFVHYLLSFKFDSVSHIIEFIRFCFKE